MAEKEQNSLTISDILDQLVRPPITQSQTAPPPQPVKPSSPSITPPVQPGGGLKLPQLGQDSQKTASSTESNQSKAELKLSVRTMASDLARLKQGQKTSMTEISKPIPTPLPTPLPPPPQPRPQPPIALPTRPPLPPPAPPPPIRPPSFSTPLTQEKIISPPPLRPSSLPPIFVPPSKPEQEEKHFHPEKVIGQDETLPPYLGALVPKRVKKPTKEKVQYGLIAKIIGSGMTTGILITLVMAGAAYGLIYFLYLKKADTPTPLPTVTPINTTIISTINELESIFVAVSVLNFQIPDNKDEVLPKLKTFINDQILSKKEFRKIKFGNQTNQDQVLSFTDLLTKLSINYPQELKSETSNAIVLIYGQEELFNDQASSVPKKVVLIAEIKDTVRMSEIMKNWESALPDNMKNLLDIDPSKQASQEFLSNGRRGVQIRYKNFPLPDKSIDYAIFSSLTNHHYLIISNSRESMYSPADKIQGL